MISEYVPYWRALLLALVAVALYPGSLAQAIQVPPSPGTPTPAPVGQPALTPVGATIVEDALTGPGIFDLGFSCPTGQGGRGFVGEGTLFKLSGKCFAGDDGDGFGTRMNGLIVPDGEVRFEFKAVTGPEHARPMLIIRTQPKFDDGAYVVAVEPVNGLVRINKFVGRQVTTLAERRAPTSLLSTRDWNTLAVRLDHTSLWVLLGDTPVLSATDARFASGEVWLMLSSIDELKDGTETAVLVRNLRVSGLEGSEQSRLPTYKATGQRDSVAAPNGPPRIWNLRFGYDRSGNGAVSSGGRLPIVEGQVALCLFDWENFPPDSIVNVEIRSNQEPFGRRDIGLPYAAGSYWFGFVGFRAAAGTGSVSGGDFAYEFIFTYQGTELARGWVTFG